MALIPLLDDIRHCRLCAEHLPLGPRPVLQADARARLLIVGQAPGLKVHETGIPFNDPSGDRLREWLGLSTEEFYDPAKAAIIPMGFCYPGRGRSGDNPPRPECASTWRERLLAELPNIELTLLIGRYAQAWHLGKAHTLTERVKAWPDSGDNRIPLPHPSPRNNLWLKRNPWFEQDVLPRLRARIDALRQDYWM